MTVRGPGTALRGIVSQYCDYTESGGLPIRRRELPEPIVVVILNFGPPFQLIDSSPTCTATAQTSFVAGLSTRAQIVESSGRSRCIQFDLTPLGARRFFGRPLSELTDQIVPWSDLASAAAGSLPERLAEARDSEHRFALLDELITTQVARRPEPPAPVAWAWDQLVDSHGRAPVGHLAGEIGWSRRHFAAQCRSYLGETPKVLARLLRFKRARALLGSGHRSGWSEIALAAGYYDQAHFIHDCREFAGLSPEALMRER